MIGANLIKKYTNLSWFCMLVSNSLLKTVMFGYASDSTNTRVLLWVSVGQQWCSRCTSGHAEWMLMLSLCPCCFCSVESFALIYFDSLKEKQHDDGLNCSMFWKMYLELLEVTGITPECVFCSMCMIKSIFFSTQSLLTEIVCCLNCIAYTFLSIEFCVAVVWQYSDSCQKIK